MAAWEDHRKKHNSKTRESLGKEYIAEMDVIEDVDGPYEDIPTSVTVTGDEWWMRYFGLTEALPWPQEGVYDDNTPQTCRNTQRSNMNLSVHDEDHADEGQTTLERNVVDTQSDVREPVMRTRDQGYVTNMIRAGTGRRGTFA